MWKFTIRQRGKQTNKLKKNSSEIVVDAERTGKFGGPWVKKQAARGHDCLALNRSWKRQERPQRCRIIFARAAELDPGGLALTAAAGHPPTRRPAWPHRLKRKRGDGAASLFLCHFTKMSQRAEKTPRRLKPEATRRKSRGAETHLLFLH